MPEHSPIGYSIGTYAAEDPDGSILHYSLEFNNYVTINPLTGSLFVKGDVDYETSVNATYHYYCHVI